ncbi:hypothetical protein [Bacillus sp. 1P02SD]|uniref:hypothetical protein n=1 Tax=Bacillus sp. 1P02SD TaxID=3132264 RepID=UPI0039A0A9C8
MAKKKVDVEEMTYKVISPFRDKSTQEVYNIGDTYEADEKRAAELKGYIDEKSSE